MDADARTKRARASEIWDAAKVPRCRGHTYLRTAGWDGSVRDEEMDGWMYVRVDLFIYVHACVRWVGMYVCMYVMEMETGRGNAGKGVRLLAACDA